MGTPDQRSELPHAAAGPGASRLHDCRFREAALRYKYVATDLGGCPGSVDGFSLPQGSIHRMNLVTLSNRARVRPTVAGAIRWTAFRTMSRISSMTAIAPSSP